MSIRFRFRFHLQVCQEYLLLSFPNQQHPPSVSILFFPVVVFLGGWGRAGSSIIIIKLINWCYTQLNNNNNNSNNNNNNSNNNKNLLLINLFPGGENKTNLPPPHPAPHRTHIFLDRTTAI
jgi:hypothetical protein